MVLLTFALPIEINANFDLGTYVLSVRGAVAPFKNRHL